MATGTYALIESVSLASAASSVTFSSIPAYRDLILTASFTPDSADDVLLCRINNDSGNLYKRVTMTGDGSGAGGTGTVSTETAIRAVFGQVSFANSAIIQFMDANQTDRHKTMIVRGDAATEETNAQSVSYASTDVISSLLLTGTQDFVAGSTFTLYGIEA